MSLPYCPVPKSSPSGTRLYRRGGHFGSGSAPARSRTPQGRFPPARLLHPGGRCGTGLRFDCPRGSPCSADRFSHFSASVISAATPRPVRYISPREYSPAALPFSAALRNHFTASFSSAVTPSPDAYAVPSSTCAFTSPDSARFFRATIELGKADCSSIDIANTVERKVIGVRPAPCRLCTPQHPIKA